MSLDITQIAEGLYNDFKTSVLASIATNSADVIAAGTSYVVNGEQRLKDTALGALNGELAYDFVVRRLKEEETTLKDALIGIEQMVASDIETLVNSLISIFVNMLKSAILSITPL